MIPKIIRLAAILGLLSLVVFATFHEPTRFVHTLQKLAHPVTFGAVALLVLTLRRGEPRRGFGAYALAFLITVLCGAGTEVAQSYVGRDPSLFDVLRDAVGAATALAGFATLIPGRDARGRGAWRVLGALLALAGLSVMVAPITLALAAYARRDLELPLLLQACSPLDRYFIRGNGADLNFVVTAGPTTSLCRSALRVEFGTAPYAGLALDEPYPDWRRARTLVLDLHNPGGLDLPLALRVHDRAHNNLFRDRFNREIILHPHERLEIAIPLAEIEHAPAGRQMDLAHIAGIVVFRDRGTMVGSFEVERMLLRD